MWCKKISKTSLFVFSILALSANADFAKIKYKNAKVITDNGAAFTSKLALIEKAEKNLDLSYFIIDSDYTSSLLAQRILEKVSKSRAEGKELKVRILVDYFMSEKQLPMLRLLEADPNIEVKRYGKPSVAWKKAMEDLGVDGPLFVSSLMAQNGAGLKEAFKNVKIAKDTPGFDNIPNGTSKNPFEWAANVVAKAYDIKSKVDRRTNDALLIGRFVVGLVDFLHRTHHKLLLADGNCFQMGGRNISDEYHSSVTDVLIQGNDRIEKRAYAFNDLDVTTCLAEKVAYSSSPITASFEALWKSSRNADITNKADFYTAVEKQETVLTTEELSKKAQEAEFLLDRSAIATEIKTDSATAVYVENKEITEFYIRALDSLEKGDEAVFVNAYFFQDIKWIRSEAEPLKRLYRSFIRAAKAGAKVKIFTNSIKTTDLNIVNAFAYPEYRRLAEAGILLYELSDKQGPEQLRSSLHMKGGYYVNKNGLKVIVGSYNLDPRSHARDTNNALVMWVPEAQQAQVKAELDAAFNTNLEADINKLSWFPITVEGDKEATEKNLSDLEKIANEDANVKVRKTLLPFKIEI